jgi:hypothetical protein
MLLAGAVLTGCNKPAPASNEAAPKPDAEAQKPAPRAETIDPTSRAIKNRLDSEAGKANALSTIHDFGIECAELTDFGFVKQMEAGEAFKAQCDDKEWYVLLESPDGPIKVVHWTGIGPPH